MNTLDDFFNNAKERNLCARGAKIWEHCKSKKSLIDFALGSWGCDYVASAIVNGWGISPDVLASEFSLFNCGKYTRDKDGYTSKLYCLPDMDSITVDSTLVLIIGHKGTIVIPKNRISEIYLVNCEVEIDSKNDKSIVNLYNSSVNNATNVKLINKN